MTLQNTFNSFFIPRPPVKSRPARPKRKRNNRNRYTGPKFTPSHGDTSGYNRKRQTHHLGSRFATAYHGTSCKQNAKSILQHGWQIGTGNVHGDGIYLSTSISEAKSYAGNSGVYIKCRVNMGRTCYWGVKMQLKYAAWCRIRNVQQDNSAKTSFLLANGYNTLKTGTIIVVLAPQYANPTAWKQKKRNISILGIHLADNDKKIRI